MEIPKGPRSVMRPGVPTSALRSTTEPSTQRTPRSKTPDARSTTPAAPTSTTGPAPGAAQSATSTGSVISTIRVARPYLTKNQIKFAQTPNIENFTVYEQRRTQVFGFLMRICQSLKFPVRTLETAMIYYQRYFLHNTFDLTGYHDVALTALFVATKNEDTVKKLRDIITVSAQLRQLTLTSEQAENYKKKIMNLEFRMLETVSFDFRLFHVEEFIVKFGKTNHVSADICYLAWQIAYDSFQLEIALRVPANAIAFACLQLAVLASKRSLVVQYKIYQCSQFAVTEAMLELLEFYYEHFNFSIFAGSRPELKDAFFNIKVEMKDRRVISEAKMIDIERDEYFRDRDFSVGERRYILSNQRKRLYEELGK